MKDNNKVQNLLSFPCSAALAQAAPGPCCPAFAPAAAVCSAAPKESLCFISWMDGPSWLERQHHGSTMCPILFNLFLIMQNFWHMSKAILHLDPYSRCLQDCKISEIVGFASACLTAVAAPLCSLFLPLPRQIGCYQSPAADIFLIIPSLQSIFCKQLVNPFWDLESLF